MTNSARLEAVRALVLAEDDRGINRTDSAGVVRLKRLVPHSSRDGLRRGLTAAARPLSRRRFAALTGGGPVRLNLGSGFEPVREGGWTNIDLVGAPVDIPWNLAHGIPLPDASVDTIFHEHLLEHLTLCQGYELNRESHRVLEPGGVLRLGVPDAGLCVRSYAGTAPPDWAESQPTPMLAVDELFYEDGHRTMYDGETLALLVEAAGFGDVTVCEWGESAHLEPAPDGTTRRDGSVYVEAVR